MSQSGRDLRHKSKQSAKLLDPEVLIDEIIRAKGPHKYQDGLHEDTWEEVKLQPRVFGLWVYKPAIETHICVATL